MGSCTWTGTYTSSESWLQTYLAFSILPVGSNAVSRFPNVRQRSMKFPWIQKSVEAVRTEDQRTHIRPQSFRDDQISKAAGRSRKRLYQLRQPTQGTQTKTTLLGWTHDT